jgi:hypothetical protein
VSGHKYHTELPTDAQHIALLPEHRDFYPQYEDLLDKSSQLARHKTHSYSSSELRPIYYQHVKTN